ncbi:IS66 family insertion sequence element accessory protein TnpB [Ensifer sp. MPMI2T]|nr:IS66 family insertion sequence element accessory protein TnpB [Ensifer sp. MPMI2T]
MSAPSSGTRTFHMIEAVPERLEGAPRQLRRRWSDEFKAQVVAEALEPGASVSAIAHRLGIHPSQLFTWRRAALNARKLSTEPARCEIAAASTGEAVIEVVIGDAVVRAGADVDEAHLQRVIRAVRSA